MSEDVKTGSDLATVAREIVGLYKTQFGRGPTSARAHWASNDTLICVLEDTLSPAERKLTALGRHTAVRDHRAALDHATLPEFCGLIEAITQRTVRAFGSSVDTVAGGTVYLVWSLHDEDFQGSGRVQRGVELGEFGRPGDEPVEVADDPRR